MRSSPPRFAVASRRVVTPEGTRAAAVIISGGRIEAIVNRDHVPSEVPVEDFDGLVISPGLVDAHVHINEPGRTDWEGFATATRAAAAGGVTTLVDMPLNSSPVTTTVAALEEKRAAAAGQCWVDVGFHAGLVPDNLADIEPLLDAGVCGVKAFMCDSGLAEFPATGVDEFLQAMPILARRQVPLLVHAELPEPQARQNPSPQRTNSEFANSRIGWETNAVSTLISLIRRFRCPTHVVHVSCVMAARAIREAKYETLPVTAETCPHYLTFASEEIPEHDARFKCAPPIYNRENRGDLWQHLIAGSLELVASDHSPCPIDMKLPPHVQFADAWGGISSLQLTLSAVWTGAAKRNVPIDKLAEWLSRNPARLVGLADRKGRIAVGCDADLCVWNHEEEWTVVGEQLQHRHKLTPYEGERLRGRVKRTYVRGQLAYADGRFPAGPIGELLRRPPRTS